MAFNQIDNTRVNAAKHIDDWYAAEVVAGKELPYASLAAAYAAIPSAVRMKGRPFLVTIDGLTQEYWWKDDLVNAIPKGGIPLDQKGAVNGVPNINTVVFRAPISTIRAFSSALVTDSYYITDKGKEGVLNYDPTDTTTTDDGIITFVDSTGRRFKRQFDRIMITWFGLVEGLSADYASNTTAIQSALDYSANKGYTIVAPYGAFYHKGNLNISKNSKLVGNSVNLTRFINTENTDSFIIPYNGTVTARDFILDQFTIDSTIAKNPNKCALKLDTCTYGSITNLVLRNHGIGFSEKVIWKTNISNIEVNGCTQAWVINGAAATPGVPNYRYNINLESNDYGIDLSGKGLGSTVFIGGSIERCVFWAIRAVPSTNRSIKFIALNIEQNNKASVANGNVNGYDVIIGDAADATSGPTNIEFDTCQFTDDRGTATKTAFNLIRGSNLILNNCNFISYVRGADIGGNFGNYSLKSCSGSGSMYWATSTGGATNGNIPITGLIDGNRNSWNRTGTFGNNKGRSNTGSDIMYSANLSGDAFDRIQIQANGDIRLGSGSGATDIYLSRIGNGLWALNNESIQLNYFSQGDADFAMGLYDNIDLSGNLTANRSFDILDPTTARAKVKPRLVTNNNTNGFDWISTFPISYAGGVVSNVIAKGSRITLVVKNNVWTAQSVYALPTTAKGGTKTITSTYAILISDYGLNGELTLLLDATSGAFTVTIPTAAQTLGLTTYFVKTDASANTPTIKGNGSELINNANTDTSLSTQNASFILKSNGTKHFKF